MLIGLGLAALTGLGVLSLGGHADNKERKEKISVMEDETAEKAEKAEVLLHKAKQDCDSSVKELNHLKKRIYSSTFTLFTDNAKKITNIDFNDRLISMDKIETMDIQMPQQIGSYSDLSNHSVKDTLGLLTGMGLAGGLVGFVYEMHQSLKLDAIEAEVEAIAEKVNLEYEQVKKECVKLNSITRLLKTANQTIETMKKLTDRAVVQMMDIIRTSGTDFNKYSDSAKEQIWITFKMIDAINQLLNMEIITPNGNVSAKYRKFVGEINTTYISGENA